MATKWTEKEVDLVEEIKKLVRKDKTQFPQAILDELRKQGFDFNFKEFLSAVKTLIDKGFLILELEQEKEKSDVLHFSVRKGRS